MFDIHEQLGKNAENFSDEDIIKAIIAGSQTGRDLTDTLSSGPSLKPESLDPVVKVLENKENHIVLWKMFPKKSVYNTVHEYNQLKSYGADVGIFMNEGESPEQTDSVYRRKAALVKYAGLQGELTQQAMLVRQADGKDPYTREVENKTLKLLTQLDAKLSSSDSALVPQEFDGVLKQHFAGVLDIYGVTTGLDTYMNDPANIDVRGKALKDSNVEDAVQAVVNDRFGEATKIISNPVVFNDYVKRFHESKRVMVNAPTSATEGATMGQKVNDIMTQFGKIDVVNDIFWDRKTPKAYNAAATSSKAPAAPTAVNNTSLTIVSADTSTKFTDGAGGYFYGVTASNQYGESAMTTCNTTIKAIGATESLDIVFAAGAGTYAATKYTIYRTIKDTAVYTTAKYYPIIEVAAATWSASGYDGGAAATVRDRNRTLPNTHVAIVLDPSVDMWEYIQLAATMKIDFAITTLARRFAVVNYGTPVLYMPGKMSVIHNIGRDLTA
jgi:hypothetical protein